MKLLKVATVALNQTPLDWLGNAANIRHAIAAARLQGASIICLPELSITGYGCEDMFLSANVQQRALQVLRDLVPHTTGVIVSLGLPLLHGGALYNCVCLVANQEIVGFVAKSRLAGDGIHYEPRWFKEWPSGTVSTIELDGEAYPIGSLIFEFGGVRVGFEICEDAWAASRPGSDLSQAAVDLVLNPSASHFAFGKQEVRRRLVLESSRAFGVTYLYANLLGNEAGRVIYDGATLIASSGRMFAEGKRLSFRDFVVTTATVDIDITRMNRARLASFHPRPGAPGSPCVRGAFRIPDAQPQHNELQLAAWETSAYVKEEEFSRAIALGLFDYLRKSRAQGFVVSLSGGADSSAVATLVWLAIRGAIQELGLDEFAAKLPHVTDLQHASSSEAIVARLLTCVYQATRNSTPTTEHAAAAVATELNADYIRLDVEPIVEAYVARISSQLGRELTWAEDDIALQNIQARVRGPSVWLIANLRKALLLATSNRSEAAVGYATMDGDTCGGLAPLAGIDKAFLREWLDWICHSGPQDLGHVPALTHVTRQEPTAELRPPEAAQTDEGDLMPYKVLDWIERAAIRDKHGPVDLFRIMRVELPTFTEEQLVTWIERFFRLWAGNQWKRERYAPSFHLDDENLDPKTWCRFPILSGGFEQELNELRELLRSERD